MKISNLNGRSLVVLLAFLISLVGCSNGASDLTGKWQITEKPQWVKSSYLAHKSDVFQFMKDGSCVWGTAGGNYKATEKNHIQVNFPMQEATPGYVGVLSYTIKGDELVLIDSARQGRIVLKRIK
ncbi:MAG: hypothetical protein KKA79_03655 [Nanoarchaeota archaeon]|nr:hypothetical protein [Nanoarchaeota archaeon]